jgi:hypothetical protein
MKFGTTLFALMVCQLPMVANAQEECVGIESDVARLECFDSAFRASGFATLSVDDAFAVFLQNISYNEGKEIAFATLEDCNLTTYYVDYWASMSSGQGNWMRGYMSTVPLANIDIELSKQASFNSLKLIAERGFSFFAGNFDNSTRNPRFPHARSQQDILPTLLSHRQNVLHPQSPSRTEATIEIVAKPLRPYTSEILSSAFALIEACQRE